MALTMGTGVREHFLQDLGCKITLWSCEDMRTVHCPGLQKEGKDTKERVVEAAWPCHVTVPKSLYRPTNWLLETAHKHTRRGQLTVLWQEALPGLYWSFGFFGLPLEQSAESLAQRADAKAAMSPLGSL